MAEKKVPYLCGGVMFFLLTQATYPKGTARDHRSGISDDHSNPLLMKDFIYTFTGETFYGADKDTSMYLNCDSEGTVNLPFNNIAIVTTYDNLIRERFPDALKRMVEFVEWHINPELNTWLVRALLEIIENDEEIPESALFCIRSNGEFVSKASIRRMTEFEIQPFLVGVLHYVLLYRREKNSLGVDTLDSFSVKKTRKPRIYTGNVGESLERLVAVSLYEFPPELCSTEQGTESVEDTRTDEEVITESLSKGLLVFAEALKANTHQIAEKIRTNEKTGPSEDEPETIDAEVVNDEKPSGSDSDTKSVIIQSQTNIGTQTVNNFDIKDSEVTFNL